MRTTTKTRRTNTPEPESADDSAAEQNTEQNTEANDPVATARADVEHQRAVLASWQTKARNAVTELEQLQSRAGGDLLDDPGAEERIAAETVRLQTGAGLAERVIAAQRPRVTRAESTYLLAEADALEPAAATAQARLDEHEAETRRLLGLLEDHEGQYVSMPDHVWASRRAGEPFESFKTPRSRPLRAAASLARRQVEVVRAFAAGRDPAQLCASWQVSPSEVYPPCLVGPDALVPTTDYLAGVQNQRDVVAGIETALEQLPREIEDLEAQLYGTHDGERRWRENTIASKRGRLSELGEELARARADLAALTGTSATSAAE